MRDSARIRNYLWRRKMVIESTFAINALEPWEKLIFFSVLSLLAFLLFRGTCRILPSQLVELQQRVSYYLWGKEVDDYVLRHWVAPPAVKDL
ncbi:hypothetical protein PAXINDRAFT_79551 [Paxillus involutus ATCC 200175]|uniref:Uncharacterized protein n=1 Tax=Paxillus involutus ATCC 200175 TaxID=664439 RepID=A0A0C9TVF8_PAXIN|nr:hypothetical protein PAXINDRAFT_79551 [Paxillus involutus ATCC 200175]